MEVKVITSGRFGSKPTIHFREVTLVGGMGIHLAPNTVQPPLLYLEFVHSYEEGGSPNGPKVLLM